MKRLIVAVGLLALAAPAFADQTDQPQPNDEQSAVVMTEAELDAVVAAGGNGNGNGKKCCGIEIEDSQFAVNVAFVSATGNADVDVTQVAVAIGELNVWFGGAL